MFGQEHIFLFESTTNNDNLIDWGSCKKFIS